MVSDDNALKVIAGALKLKSVNASFHRWRVVSPWRGCSIRLRNAPFGRRHVL